MDWYPFPGEFEAALGRALGPWPGHLDEAGIRASGAPTCSTLTAVDLDLIDVIYGFVAAESTCSTCGAPLGRSLRVIPWSSCAAAARWQVHVTTRCRGWRRHRHVAAVTGRRHLELGPLSRR
jgi:hypothetical protein